MPPIPTVRPNGAAIKTFRKIRELTIKQCAEKAGSAISAVYYYENGKRCSLEQLRKIARALDVPVAAICMDEVPDEDVEPELVAS
jgi:transcriptional regulator with XRE-family HTH domain